MARTAAWTAVGFSVGCAVGYQVATSNREAVDSAVHAVVEQTGAHLRSAWREANKSLQQLPTLLPPGLKKKLLDAPILAGVFARTSSDGDGDGGGSGGSGGAVKSGSGSANGALRSVRTTADSLVAEDASTPASPTASSAAGSEALLAATAAATAASAASASAAAQGERLKVAVVVRADAAARWPPGRLAVTVSSALLSLYKRVYSNRALRPLLPAWEAQRGGAKVVLRAPDEAALGRLMDAARAAGVPAHALLESVPAAGDETPRRARTLLALGPAPTASLEALGLAALPAI